MILVATRNKGRKVCRSEVDKQLLHGDEMFWREGRGSHLEEGELLTDLIYDGKVELATAMLDQPLERIVGELCEIVSSSGLLSRRTTHLVSQHRLDTG